MANGNIPQGQGFYDPLKAGPNIPQGLRGMLNQMMMLKQLKEKRGQQEFERDITERETASKEEYYGALAEKAKRPETGGGMNQWQYRANFAKELLDTGVIGQEEHDKYMLTGQLDKPLSEYQILLQSQKKIGDRKNMFKTMIGAFEGRKKFLDQPLSFLDAFAAKETGADPNLPQNRAAKSMNLGFGLSELKRMLGRLETGQLTDQEYAQALNIYSRMSRIEESGPYWEGGAVEEADIKGKFGLPKEVQKFLLDHPEMTIGEALQLYKEMKIKK